MVLIGVGVALVLLAGVIASALRHRFGLADRIFFWGTLAGCAFGLSGAVSALLPGSPAPALTTRGIFGLDPLSAWFAVIVFGVGAAIAGYGTRYLALARPKRHPGHAHLLLAILLVALVGVLLARTVVAFLAAWEVMAVSAWLLVIFEHEDEEVRRAGFIYLLLTHVSTIALLGMFSAWGAGPAGRIGHFADLAAAVTAHRVPVNLVLTLALIGFGIKAGAVPGHFWLPAAHAAAPSHISALLSGVMLKIGIYGFFRVLTLLGAVPAWWGWTVLLLGVVSSVLGVLWALAQHDLKRLLAYHSVENIGIILMGVGLGALGLTYHRPLLALLGFVAALLHSLNHALFKSLLFLAAGVLARVAGTREIDRLGGLGRVVPRTALGFLIGSAAIVGLPPLNGFVSEWLLFRGLFDAAAAEGTLRTASAAAVGLALSGALALACFTKVYGVVMLGTPRRDTAPDPLAERGLLIAPWALAVACVLVGVLPAFVVPVALRAATATVGALPTGVGARILAGSGAISFLALGLLALVMLIGGLRALSRRRAVRAAPTWACAFPGTTSRMQYTASSYAAGLLSHFGSVSGIARLQTREGVSLHADDPILDRIGRPVWDRIHRAALSMRRIQTGRIVFYLLYVITALIALVFYLWLSRP